LIEPLTKGIYMSSSLLFSKRMVKTENWVLLNWLLITSVATCTLTAFSAPSILRRKYQRWKTVDCESESIQGKVSFMLPYFHHPLNFLCFQQWVQRKC